MLKSGFDVVRNSVMRVRASMWSDLLGARGAGAGISEVLEVAGAGALSTLSSEGTE
jgi:hypothetical protein